MDQQKQFIVKKASELFNLYGFKSVTMDDISREIGISKKTLYVHFNSKKDLISYLLQEFKKQFEVDVKNIQHKEIDSLEKLYKIYLQLINFLNEINSKSYWSFKKYYPDLFAKFFDTIGELIDEIGENLIIEAQWDQHIISEVNAKVFSYILRNSLLNFPKENLILNNKVNQYTFQKEIFFYILRSVATVSGITQLNGLKKELK